MTFDDVCNSSIGFSWVFLIIRQDVPFLLLYKINVQVGELVQICVCESLVSECSPFPQIIIGAPTLQQRKAILSVLCERMPVCPSVNLTALAQTTTGYVGADLSALCREAAMHAIREDSKVTTAKQNTSFCFFATGTTHFIANCAAVL